MLNKHNACIAFSKTHIISPDIPPHFKGDNWAIWKPDSDKDENSLGDA